MSEKSNKTTPYWKTSFSRVRKCSGGAFKRPRKGVRKLIVPKEAKEQVDKR